MANTFNRTTKSSLTTGDVTTDPTTNVLPAGVATSLILISVLISNKSGSNANVTVYLVTAAGDDTYLLKGAPVPSGSTLEMIQGSRIVLTASDVIRASSDTALALDVTISYLAQN
jgi:hypothetical protein